MATRDIELVIRARDTATKAVQNFTTALQQIVTANTNLNQSSKTTESTLEKLGATIRDIAASVEAVSPTGRLAQESERAASSIRKLETSLTELRGEQSKQQEQLRSAAQETVRYVTTQERLSAELKQQKQALKESEAAFNKSNKAVQQAALEREKLQKEEIELAQKIQQTEQAIIKQSVRYGELASNTQKVLSPTKTFAAQLTAAGTALDKQQQKLIELNTALSANSAAQQANASRVPQLTQAYRQAEAVLLEAKTRLEALSAQYKETEAETSKVVGSQKELQTAFGLTAKEAGRQETALNKIQKEYNELSGTIREAEEQLSRLAGALGGRLQQALNNHVVKVGQSKREWNSATQGVRQLAIAMKESGATAESQAGFDRAIQTARVLKAAYQENRIELNTLKEAFRAAGGSVGALEKFQRDLTAATAEFNNRARVTETTLTRIASNAERAANSARKTAQGIRQVGAEAGGASGRLLTLQTAIDRFYGGTRQALSFLQRGRGQILAFIAAHAGLFGIITALRNVVEAYQTLEAATSRLNVVAEGNFAGVSQELDFLRRTADRLGISFGTLSDFYTKFAVATKGTNLEGANTRKIFLSVAEAGRVNKLSLEQLAGVFRALEQIVSKGTFQMEELRGQLGDRLPGAVRIMADALGISTKELEKMTEQSELTSDALVAFAEELDRRFGSQLQAALKTTSAEIGRFQNNLFKTLIVFGEGGFIEAFTDLLVDLNEVMTSSQGITFFQNLSVAAAGLADTIAFLARNFELVSVAIGAFVGLKLAPFFLVAISAIKPARAALVQFGAAATAAATQVRAASVAVTGFSFSVRGAVASLVALRAAIFALGGGVVIAAVTAVGAAIGYWITQTDDATDALVQHNKILDKIKNAYEANNAQVEGLREKLTDISVVTAVTQLENLRDKSEDVVDSLEDMAERITLLAHVGADEVQKGIGREVTNLLEQLRETKDVDAFIERLDKMGQAAEEAGEVGIRRYIASIIEAARKGRNLIDTMRQQELVVKFLTGSIEEQREALEALSNSQAADTWANFSKSTDAATVSSEQVKNALKDVDDILDDVRDQLDDATDNLDNFADSLDGITATQAEAQLRTLLKFIDQTNKEMQDLISGVDQPSPEDSKLAQLLDMFVRGIIPVEDFRRRIDDLAESSGNQAFKELALSMLDILDTTDDARDKAGQLVILLKAMRDEGEDVGALWRQLKKEDPFEKANKGLDKLINGFQRVDANRLRRVMKDVGDDSSFLERFNKKLDEAVEDIRDLDPKKLEEGLVGPFRTADEAINDYKSSSVSALEEVSTQAGTTAGEVDIITKAFSDIQAAGEVEELATALRNVGSAAEKSAKGVANLVNTSTESTKQVVDAAKNVSGETAQTLLAANQEFYTKVSEQYLAITQELIEASQARIEAFRAEGTARAEEFSTTLRAILEALRAAIEQIVAQAQAQATRMGAAVSAGAATAQAGVAAFVAAAIADLERLVAAANRAAAAVAAVGSGSGSGSAPTFTPRASGGSGVPGRARGGGQVRGRGTSTSDSNLFWLSRDEWVIQASAVRHYGSEFIRRINSMVFPKSIMGLKRGGPAVSVPGLRAGGSSNSKPSGLRMPSIVLNIMDERFTAFTDEKTFRAMNRVLKKKRPRVAGKLSLKDV